MSLFTPSDLTSRLLVAWVPAYTVMMIHGALIVPLADFLEIFLFYPILCGTALAIFNFKFRDENEEFLEKIGFPYTKSLIMAVVILMLLPIAGVLFAMVSAQMAGSYNDVAWIVIVFGTLIGGQLGEKLKFGS